MKNARKPLALALSLSMAFSLAACGGSASTATSTATSSTAGDTAESVAETSTTAESTGSHTLRVGVNCTFASMAPFTSFSIRGATDHNIYETLAILDGVGGPLTGIIAKSWETTDDGTTWNIEIYDYVHDTDGNPITASDVVWCYEQAIAAGIISKVDTITATGDYTLELKLTSNALGYFNTVMQGVNIVSQQAYEASADGFATAPIGTTQYAITDYVPGAYVTFTKTNDYWQTDESLYGPFSAATVDEITYVTIQESSQMTIALEAGTIDAMDELPNTELESFQEGGVDADQFTLYSIPLNQAYVTFFSGDETSAVHDDLNLRLAIAYAIDSEGLVAGVMDGLGTVVEAFGAPLFDDYPTVGAGDYFVYDPDLAAEYLAKSNYNGEAIRILCSSSTTYNKEAQVIQNYLNNIGINVEILSLDEAVVHTYSHDPTKFDMYLTRCGSSDYLATMWSSYWCAANNDGVSTRHGWVDAELEELMLTVLTEEGHTLENMNAVQQVLNDNCYGLGFFYVDSYEVWNKDTGIASIPADEKGLVCWYCVEWA